MGIFEWMVIKPSGGGGGGGGTLTISSWSGLAVDSGCDSRAGGVGGGGGMEFMLLGVSGVFIKGGGGGGGGMSMLSGVVLLPPNCGLGEW